MLKKRNVIAISIVLIIAVTAYLYSIYAQFVDYTTEKILRTENAGRTFYEKAIGGIISYNPDGAALMDYDGISKWNISYEMQNPCLEVSDKYVLIYDKQGSTLEIADINGETTRVNTSYPISTASISGNGCASIVMQQQEDAKIITYDYEGNIIAEGLLRAGDTGYPLALSLSSDGEQLVVSVLHLSEADIKTEILFYDFSDKGKEKDNNIISTFSFSDTIIPIVDHVKDDQVFAVGSNNAIIFNGKTEPKVAKEIFYSREIKSVVYNQNYFGIIVESGNEEGELSNILDLYSVNGNKKFSKNIDISYSTCELMDNDELFFTDGKSALVYTTNGVKKFSYNFDTEIQKIMPFKGLRNYYLVQSGELSIINIR